MRCCVVPSVLVLCALCGWASRAAATSCFFDNPQELLVPGISLEARVGVGIDEAPPGGLWWLEIIDDVDTGRCDDLQVRERGEDINVPGRLIAVAVVRVGPRSMAVRVPSDLAEGTILDAVISCEANSSVGGFMLVGPPQPLKPVPPTFTVTNVEQLEWTVPGCGFGGREQTNHRTMIDVSVDDPSDPQNPLTGRCDLSGHPCFENFECDIITCVDGGCLIGANCVPSNDASCADLRDD